MARGSIPSNLPKRGELSPTGSQMMDRQHLSTTELLTIDPKIRCFDCNKRLLDSPDHETWTCVEANYFCAQCSAAEKIEATSGEQDAMDEAQSIRNHVW
jgi:DNA-directed RNA polymerase subunit RPC12/RpoP